MQFVLIFLLSVAAAVVYGIVHDQITARICVEYFTVAHPPVFHTDNPTLLGLGWGVIATWWVGAMLGVPLALAARYGNYPKRTAREMIKPMGVLVEVMGVCAAAAGMAGWWMSRNGSFVLPKWLADAVPVEKHAAFSADAFAHLASYGVGFAGGVILVVYTLYSRSREQAMRRIAEMREKLQSGLPEV